MNSARLTTDAKQPPATVHHPAGAPKMPMPMDPNHHPMPMPGENMGSGMRMPGSTLMPAPKPKR